MSTAPELLRQYREAGHSDEHIRRLALDHPAELRTELLAALDAEPRADAVADPADDFLVVSEKPESVLCVLFDWNDVVPTDAADAPEQAALPDKETPAQAPAAETVPDAVSHNPSEPETCPAPSGPVDAVGTEPSEPALDDVPRQVAESLGLLSQAVGASPEQEEIAALTEDDQPHDDAATPEAVAESATATESASASDDSTRCFAMVDGGVLGHDSEERNDGFDNLLECGGEVMTRLPSASAPEDSDPDDATDPASALLDKLMWTAESDLMRMEDEDSQVIALNPPWAVSRAVAAEDAEDDEAALDELRANGQIISFPPAVAVPGPDGLEALLAHAAREAAEHLEALSVQEDESPDGTAEADEASDAMEDAMPVGSIIRIGSPAEWHSLLGNDARSPEARDEDIRAFARRHGSAISFRDCAGYAEADDAPAAAFPGPTVVTFAPVSVGDADDDEALMDARARADDAEARAAEAEAVNDELKTRFSDEVLELRRWLGEITDSLQRKEKESRDLSGLLAARDETLNLQNDELLRLRATLAEQEKAVALFHAERRERAEAAAERDRFKSLNDELSRITVPALETRARQLQEERDDLETREKTVRAKYARTRNHVAVGYGAAVAAVLLGVFLTGFALTRGGKTDADTRQQYAEAMTEKNALLGRLEQSRAQLSNLERVNLELTQDRDRQRNLYEVAAKSVRAMSTQLDLVSTRVVALQRELQAKDEAIRVHTGGGRNNGTFLVSGPASGGNPANAVMADNPLPGGVASRHVPAAGGQPAYREVVFRQGDTLAQLVQRELNTLDTAMVDEVIRANGIRVNSRGNPIIQPNQVIRIPADTGASASLSPARGNR